MKTIVSRENPLFKTLRRLAELPRERRRSRQTLLDGPHLVGAALDAGCSLRHLLLNPAARANVEIGALLARVAGVEPVELAPALLAELSPVASPVGVVACIEVPRADPAPAGDFWLVLEDLQDPGNLGSMLRSAAAAGVSDVWLSPGSAEAWSPKALRGGMGAQFRLRIHEAADLAAVLAGFSGTVLATVPSAGASLFEQDLRGPLALLVGNEGAGLSAELVGLADRPVRIPMPGGAESLNAAAAAAVVLFECVRQRLDNCARSK